ncbi:MAG: hypothetical protein ACKVS8_00870 [Phycisphaerales bacterium]
MCGRLLAPRTSVLVVLVVLVVLGGCQGPGLGAGFDAPDPAAQIHAALTAARDGDRSRIPDLIEMLESDDQAARVVAISSLERFTGERLGYDHAAPTWERRAMVARWRAWLKENPPATAAAGGPDAVPAAK